MLYGNQKIIETLDQYLDQFFKTGKGVPFFILVGPRGIGKSSHAQTLIQKYLGNFYPNDFLYFKDYSDQIGKKHAIPVELNERNRFISKSSKKEEDSDNSNEETWESKGEKYPNLWIREMISRLQTAPLGDKKIVLIEDLQRAYSEWQNALLKTLEEPLKQRVIIATLQEENQILPTILSRAIVLHLTPLSDKEMEHFIQQIPKDLLPQNQQITKIISEMAMGRPGIFLSLLEKSKGNPELLSALPLLFSNTEAKVSTPIYTLQKHFQKIIETGLINEFVDGWINHCIKENNPQEAQRRIEAKRIADSLAKSGVSWERLFLSLMISK